MLYIGYVQMKSNKLQKVTALFKIVYYLRTGPVGVFFITGGQHVYSLMCLCAQDTTNFKSGINSTIFTAVVFWLSTRQRCNSQAQKTLRECVGWGEKCGNVFVIRQQKLCLGCCFFFTFDSNRFILFWFEVQNIHLKTASAKFCHSVGVLFGSAYLYLFEVVSFFVRVFCQFV